MPNKKPTETVFSIVFKKGMADKNRLPLVHVLSTLREIDSMIREVGRKVQQEAGVQNPDGDFGVELLAGPTGLAFKKGSIQTASALTNDVENGTETIRRIITTTDIIEKKRVIPIDEYRIPVLRRLAAIGSFQEKDKTEINIRLAFQGKIREHANFSERGIRAVRRMSAAELTVESVTIYGKLRGLTDQSRGEREDDIWGEMIEDSGEKWRIKFHPTDLDKAKKLFTKQVMASGDATYFKTNFPRLDVKAIVEDKQRDYVKAFDRFSEGYERVFKERNPEEILNDIRG
jgi:hypothetical protein